MILIWCTIKKCIENANSCIFRAFSVIFQQAQYAMSTIRRYDFHIAKLYVGYLGFQYELY